MFWQVHFYLKHNHLPLWEISTNRRVENKKDAIKLIEKGIIKIKTTDILNNVYKFLELATWRVDIGVPNSIEITYLNTNTNRKETICVTSYRKEYVELDSI